MELGPNRSETGLSKDVVEKTPEPRITENWHSYCPMDLAHNEEHVPGLYLLPQSYLCEQLAQRHVFFRRKKTSEPRDE
jgi:hypothetical protein